MEHDVIVVGGSFAGIAAALPLARARRKVLLVDARSPRNRFARHAQNLFGQDGKPPHEIVAEARRQLLAYPTVRYVEGIAATAEQTDGGFAVELASGERELAARLILATGVRDEIPDRPGFRERWGVSLVHCPYCHGYEQPRGQYGVLRTSVQHAPGTDESVVSPMQINHAALIGQWGPVTLFTDGLPVDDAGQALLDARGIAVETAPVVALLGDAPLLEGVQFADGRVVPIVALFAGFPTVVASPLAEQLGCAFEQGQSGLYIRTNDMRETSVPGVFAAGDAATQMHNATLALSAGMMAGTAAHRSLVFPA